MPSDGNSLNWDLFITPGEPIVADPAPGTKETFWQPTTSTLIYGKTDAILVDAPTTWRQGVTLGLWVKDSGKNLKAIYITHGHGDHWFGAVAILDRFPRAKLVATPGVVREMRENVSPEVMKFWNGWFPSQVPKQLVFAEELKGNQLDLEGNELRVVEVGHTDTDDTTCLYVPSLGLVVAGDAVYNRPHLLFLRTETHQKREEWLAALDKIKSLNPRIVIAGHKTPGTDNDPRIIEDTRQYIGDFDELAESTRTAKELYDQMLDLYPDRLNPYALWLGVQAAKAGSP